jgi:hypothetical protein
LPSSSHLGLSVALDHVVGLRPRRVLDVGIGFGKWGFLIREALDFVDGRLEREDWQVTIDGVDAYRYDSPLLDWVYDSVRIADVLDIVDELVGYDVVVIGDMIEHVEKEQGIALLDALLRQNRNVVLSTPYRFFEQEVPGNPFERHRSHWTIDDFTRWTIDYDIVGGFLIVVALAGKGADRPRSSDARASRIVYRLPFVAHHGAVARVLKGLVRRVG